jgi:transcriptional regulator with PAS, ATPase and Fis domain
MDESKIKSLKQRYSIIGNCEELNHALNVALQVAPTDLSVLVTGENGTGKEIFARIIHDNSIRKGKKFFTVNCGAIPEGTIDSELFGHEKGAFTGAVDEREGYFGIADGGTLFLDEVGELPLPTQARLLRVLETGEYIRVGSSEIRKTNVRIVAATNVNIPKAISEGRFREDLYYRLNTIPVHVPPLRERGRDIILLFMKFALEMSEKYKMPALRLTKEAEEQLMAYSWPGNVRQLKNITENMSITSGTHEITPEILDKYEILKEKQSTELVSMNNMSEHSYATEREYLIQFLFGLREEIKDLKNLVAKQDERLKEIDLQHVVTAQDVTNIQNIPVQMVQSIPASVSHLVNNNNEYVESAQENFSMADIEKEAIRLAMIRHKGKKKIVADELKISPRTLYRKIKEYGLE